MYQVFVDESDWIKGSAYVRERYPVGFPSWWESQISMCISVIYTVHHAILTKLWFAFIQEGSEIEIFCSLYCNFAVGV